ncbi:hypothetical protein OROMI_002152 [Orobanche minor]
MPVSSPLFKMSDNKDVAWKYARALSDEIEFNEGDNNPNTDHDLDDENFENLEEESEDY